MKTTNAENDGKGNIPLDIQALIDEHNEIMGRLWNHEGAADADPESYPSYETHASYAIIEAQKIKAQIPACYWNLLME
jgi:hypothetical protein